MTALGSGIWKSVVDPSISEAQDAASVETIAMVTNNVKTEIAAAVVDDVQKSC